MRRRLDSAFSRWCENFSSKKRKVEQSCVLSPVGLVQRLEVDGEEIRAKIGSLTAPLNFEQVVNRNGPRLDAVQCR